jgi:NADPH:quinone reductase
MRSVIYTENGPSSVLQSVERPVPTPGFGEVRVRLERAGVNPTDSKSRSGASATIAFAGVVDAVGEGVSGLATGDRVWLYLVQDGRPYGTAAEYCTAQADRAVRLPDSASFDLGASLGVPALTAHRALTSGDVERLAPESMRGRTVLVHGGAGAVGNAAIQLATWAGADVVTTVSTPEKAELASAAGAAHVINYRTGDTAAAIREIAPVDLVVDVAPAANNDLNRQVVAPGATIAIYANNGGNELTMPLRETFSLNLRYQFILLYGVPQILRAAAAADITAAIEAGALRVGEDAGLPLIHYPLDRTAEAHDAVDAGAVGKVLIDLT